MVYRGFLGLVGLFFLFGHLVLCTEAIVCPHTKRFRDPLTERTHFGQPLPNTLLYSFEGSGNTWTRWLFENCTGIWTGAIYNDRSLRLGLGFLGEGVQNNSVILVKSHHFYGPKFMAPLFNLTIHLIRSPFSSLPAERKRVVSVHNEHVNSPSWSEFVLGQTMPGDPWRLTSKVHWSNWTSLAAQRLLKTIKFVDEIEEVHNMPVHTMRFEDLKHRLLPTMKDALKFIGENPAAAKCLAHKSANSSSTQARRQPAAGYPDCVFSKAQLEELLSMLGLWMDAHGYAIPRACVDVLTGETPGGIDAMPV